MDSDAIDQFVSVTGSNPDTAKFFIESSNNDVAAAIDQYFSAGGQVQAEEAVPAAASQSAAATASAITPASTGPKPSAPAVAKPMAGQAPQAKGDQFAPNATHAWPSCSSNENCSTCHSQAICILLEHRKGQEALWRCAQSC